MLGISRFNRGLMAAIVAGAALSVTSTAALAAGGEVTVPRQVWSFSGVTGHYDRAQVQRGYRVYKEVCAACHGMRLLSFRNLAEPGGPGFTEEQVKALAAEYEVEEIGDDGTLMKRPAKPSDRFPSPFPNDQAARSANGGALPPDLSLIGKARGAADVWPWYLEPVKWARDIATGYQEGGPDYLTALLTGYAAEPPAYVRNAAGHLEHLKEGTLDPKAERCAVVEPGGEGKPDVCSKLQDGLYYNTYFPGHQIAMPNPLADGQIEYTDGSPATAAQYATDVSAFLMWAAEPHLEARKQLGLRVIIYLAITAFLLWLAKRMLWSRIGH